MEDKKYKLLDDEGKTFISDTPGLLGGNKKLKIYGRLDCKSANRWIQKGYYVQNRVFFADEQTAIEDGYRPCGVCMPDEYEEWKNNQMKLTLNKK